MNPSIYPTINTINTIDTINTINTINTITPNNNNDNDNNQNEINQIKNNIEILEIMESIVFNQEEKEPVLEEKEPVLEEKEEGELQEEKEEGELQEEKVPDLEYKMGSCVVAAKQVTNKNKDIEYVPLVFRMSQKDYVGGSKYGPTIAELAYFKELMPNNSQCPTHCILWNQTNRRIYDPMFKIGAPNEEIPIATYFQELVKKDVIDYNSKCKELMFDVEYLSAQGYAENRATYPEHDFPIAVVKVNVETYEVSM